MNLSIWSLVALVPPLLLIESFFSGSEIALLSADKLHLKTLAKRGSSRAKLAFELASHPERVLSATLIMTCFCITAISALIALYVLSHGYRHADLIAVGITSPLIVIFGELVPKTIYQRYANQTAPWVAFPVNAVYWGLYPLTRLLSAYTARLSRLLGPIEEMVTGRRRNTREELRSLLSYGKKESEIKSSEKQMIKRIFDFKDTEAKHALIPLVKVEAIEDSTTIVDALKRFQQHRHSRMPVYADRIDNIIGVLEVSDLFGVTDVNQSIHNYMTPAHYVAETQSLEDLLSEMKHEDNEMVVVVDEYGGAIGILTFEDIVEEIVGEINDEYDSERPAYKELDPGKWVVQSRMEISQANEQLGLDLPEGDYETVGGFLLQQFGRIPELGDELHFDVKSGPLRFTIRKADARRIEMILIERLDVPSEN